MLKEIAVERYRFTCAGCGHAWSTDYDVQHVEDGHGLTWEYYSLNGIPVPSPTAPGTLSCPCCGATWIHFELIATRGQVAPDEMERTFNLGVGMVAVVAADSVPECLALLDKRGVEAWVLGALRAAN